MTKKQTIEELIEEKVKNYYSDEGDENWYREQLQDIAKSAKEEGRREVLEEVEKKIDKVYSDTEKDLPPDTFYKWERNYNEGFQTGRLKAMETVCREVLGKGGDDIADKSLSNNPE